MDKYKNIPIISADDDCIYTCNYAQNLYNTWNKNKLKCIVRYTKRQSYNTQGPCSLYYIKSQDVLFLLRYIKKKKINFNLDDDFYSKMFKHLKYKLLNTGNTKFPFIFHDMISPITKDQQKNPTYKGCFR